MTIKDDKKKKKKDTKLAKLREVAPGIAGNDSTLKLLKRLGITAADLLKIKAQKRTKKKTKTT